MVSKPFVCENDEAAGDNEVEELPGDFGHPQATQNWDQPFVGPKILIYDWYHLYSKFG